MTSDPPPDPPSAVTPPDGDDLDDFRTPLVRLREHAVRWVAVLVAAALIVPAGMWLVDEIRFRLAGAAVIETLAGEVSGSDVAETIMLVQVSECATARRATGSAFVVELPDGPALVTNRHVVDNARTVGVRTLSGSTALRIAGVRVSDLADVAVLEVDDPAALPPALRLATAAVSSGQDVRLVGFPAAAPFTTSGTVEAALSGRLLLHLDVDPGASGSPVVDDGGQVVGQIFGVTDDGLGVATSAALLVEAAAQTRPVAPC